MQCDNLLKINFNSVGAVLDLCYVVMCSNRIFVRMLKEKPENQKLENFSCDFCSG